MRAGRLRHLVDIQQLTSSTGDGMGPPAKTWSTEPVETVWASVEPISGREYFAAGQIQADISHRVGMRYTSNMTPERRIRFGSRYLYPESVINRNERNIELEIFCKERA